jgi:4-amino-4-deoxy-L-arabinose transferase-like glycosyltransferase
VAGSTWAWARRHADVIVLGAVLVVAIAFRLGFALRVAPFITKDSQSYFLPGWDLLESGTFNLGLRRTPGYPLVIAAVLGILGDDLRGLMLAQHALGVATTALTYAMARTALPAVGAGVAAVLVAISGPLIAYEHFILTETLFCFVLTGALCVACRSVASRGGRWSWWFAGVLVGLSVLVRPVGQLLLPIVVLAALAAHPRARRTGFMLAGVAALGYVTILGPWWLWNQIVRDIQGTSTFGRTLIARTAYYDRCFVFYDPNRLGTSPDPEAVRARRIVQQGADRQESDGTIAQRLRQELGLSGPGVNTVMRQIAVEAIVANPACYVEGTVRFAVRIFNGVDVRIRDVAAERRDVVWEDRVRLLLPARGDSEDDFRAASRLMSFFQPARFAPLGLLFFLAGSLVVCLHAPSRPLAVPVLAVVGLVFASAALDGPQERYRYPADPAIAVVIIAGALGWIELVRARGRPRAPSTAR